MTPSSPGLIQRDGFRERVETPDGSFKLGIAMDEASHGSKLWFGVATLQSNAPPVSWEAAGDTHEAYYLVSGAMRISWAGPDTGEVTLVGGDAFYFAPSRKYTIRSAAEGETFFIFAVTPAPEGSTT